MTDPTDDTPRTRTDVVDRGREWLRSSAREDNPRYSPTTHGVVRDLLAEVEALRAERERLLAIAGCADHGHCLCCETRDRKRIAKLKEAEN